MNDMIICRENILMEMLEWTLHSVHNNISDANFFSNVNLNIAVIFDLAVQKGFQLQTTEVHVYLLDVMDFSKKNLYQG